MVSAGKKEKPTCRLADRQQATSAAPSSTGFSWPFRHRVSELGDGVWEEVKAALIEDTASGDSHREPVLEGGRFIARRPLDKESSVLESSAAQIWAMEQFLLPKDVEMLQALPSVGLHLALKCYFLWGALLEHELFSRLSYAHKLPADFEEKLAKERMAREIAEERVTALEAELSCNDGKWRQELQMKDDLIKGYKIHRAKHSASIEKLEGERAELKEGVDYLEKEVARRDARIKYLEEEVDLEKRHRLEARERARSERLAADHTKLDLKEEQADHEKTQAAVQALEPRVAFLDSETSKAKVIEEYRQSALGKVEVALAYKAGFDYLASQLPPGSRPLTDSDYPPRVSVCLDFLREIETARGGTGHYGLGS